MRARHLAVVAVAGVLVFIAVALLVQEGRLAGIDAAVMQTAHRVRSPALDAVMLTLSTIGGSPTVIAMVVLCALWTVRRGDRRAALVLAVVGIGDELTTDLLKHGFQRARPDLWPRPFIASFSFPSGHAMTAVAVFGMMALLVARARPGATAALWVAAPLLGLGIGASRVYLGVHWPSDVVAGYAVGLVLLVVGAAGLQGRGAATRTEPASSDVGSR